MPPLGEACVCNPWNHRDPFGLLLLLFLWFAAGGPSMCCARWSNEAATTHADIWPDQPDVPAFLELLNFGKGPVSSADLHATTSSCRLVARLLPFGPYFLLKTSRIQRFVRVPLGIGTLGRRVEFSMHIHKCVSRVRCVRW